MVVEKYKSGFSPPGDIPFEDLTHNMERNGGGGGGGGMGGSGDGTTDSINGSMQNMQMSHSARSALDKKPSLVGTIGGKIKKRSGLLNLFNTSKVYKYDLAQQTLFGVRFFLQSKGRKIDVYNFGAIT